MTLTVFLDQVAFMLHDVDMLQGVASGTQLLAFACAGEIVPKKWRGQTLAAMNFAALPGSCFGSVIGM